MENKYQKSLNYVKTDMYCENQLRGYKDLNKPYLDTLQELIDGYNKVSNLCDMYADTTAQLEKENIKLEKALDIACKILNRYEEKEYKQMGFDEIEIDNSTKTPDEWKEYLLQESEEQNEH